MGLGDLLPNDIRWALAIRMLSVKKLARMVADIVNTNYNDEENEQLLEQVIRALRQHKDQMAVDEFIQEYNKYMGY